MKRSKPRNGVERQAKRNDNKPPENEIYITKDIKRGFQQNNHYKELYKLVYNFKNEYITYMNFPVEIVFGRKTTGKLVQYSIEYKKTVSKSMPEPI